MSDADKPGTSTERQHSETHKSTGESIGTNKRRKKEKTYFPRNFLSIGKVVSFPTFNSLKKQSFYFRTIRIIQTVFLKTRGSSQTEERRQDTTGR